MTSNTLIITKDKATVKRSRFFGDRTPEQIKKLMDAYMKGKVGHHVGPVSYKGGY